MSTLDPVYVTVEMPLDILGSVLVPVSAIVISTLVAVAIARQERRAAARGRQEAEIHELALALSRVGAAAADNDDAARLVALNHFYAVANALLLLVGRKEQSVVSFFVAVVESALENGNPAVANATAFCGVCLVAWRREDLLARQFQGVHPLVPVGESLNVPSPADWKQHITR